MKLTRSQAILAILSILFWAGGSVLADRDASLESLPFAERSGALDTMGFTLIAPEDVGVQVEVYGYVDHGSYFYPGGMGLQNINPQG